MEERIFGLYEKEPGSLEKENRRLARKAAQESFVLLKNNGALPLKNREIALYGMGARKTVKGGLGSGSVEERYSVTIEEGLLNAGYKITTQGWLNDYDSEYDATYKEWHNMVESKVAGLTDPMKIIPLAHSYVYRYPSGRPISSADIENSHTDTAVYVLMRQAGECNDRRLEKGDYYITDIEKENLKIIAEEYAHTVLIINVGGGLDLKFMDEIPGIDAVVMFVQGGMEGGNALADVLSGSVNFSGKLADTIPLRYEDVPFGDEFSYLNGKTENEDYKEGIYVGYRYYDSFRLPVRFPFGYGLSYTIFEIGVQEVRVQESLITVSVMVTNTGNTFAGREVVQVYLSAPEGELEKEYQSLAAFAKTRELACGDSQLMQLTFDLRNMASYSEQKAQYLLEKGNYILRVGNSSRNTTVAAVLQLDEAVTVSRLRNCCSAEHVIQSCHHQGFPMEEIPSGIQVIRLDAEMIAERIEYAEPFVTESLQEKELLDSLTEKEMASLVIGGDLRSKPVGTHEVLGAGGKTATGLVHKGISNAVFSDGPAGINISNEVRYYGNGEFGAARVPERYNWGMMGKMAARNIRQDGKMVYRFATAWPVEMLLAQSWNIELLEQIGMAVAEEMKLFGITLWLAPGMNIHRNPLGGRNFEYYSEDPLITGKMAAAITRGVQSRKETGTVIKHFCCNDAENNRNHSSSNVDERALREIHLRGFEIAVRESQPKAVMSSYNMLNHIYTANRHDLLTDILRCEWKFEGFVMTDWCSCGKTAGKPQLCVPSGNDLIMPGSKEDLEAVFAAMEDGTITADALRRSACRILHMLSGADILTFSGQKEIH